MLGGGHEVDEILISSDRVQFDTRNILPTGSSVVECQTHNRDSLGSNPLFATVSRFGHFRSLHDVHSAV